MARTLARVATAGGILAAAGFFGVGSAHADCTSPPPVGVAPLAPQPCLSQAALPPAAPVQDPRIVPKASPVPDIFGLENKVYTTARSFVNRSDSGSQAQGNQAQGSQAGGGTPAGSGAAGTDPAAGSPADAAGAQTLVLGDRIAAAPPVVAGAAAPDLSMIPAQNGSTAQGAPSAALIAPAAASGVNGPVGLSAMIIVIATATVVGAGVVQLRVMQLRRAAG